MAESGEDMGVLFAVESIGLSNNGINGSTDRTYATVTSDRATAPR